MNGSIYNALDTSIAISQTNQNSLISSRAEVDKYLAELPLGRMEDPLKWWDERKKNYPRLIILVPRYLAIIMNSVSCERIFSKMGLIVNDRRTSLSADKASMVCCIAQNLSLFPNKSTVNC